MLTPPPVMPVDERGGLIADPSGVVVGKQGFVPNAGATSPDLSKYRVVSAVALDNGPRLLERPLLAIDQTDALVADRSGYLLGPDPGLWIFRMVSASVTEDIRAL